MELRKSFFFFVLLSRFLPVCLGFFGVRLSDWGGRPGSPVRFLGYEGLLLVAGSFSL